MKKTSTPEAPKRTAFFSEKNLRELKNKIKSTLDESLLSKSSFRSVDWKTLLSKAGKLIYSRQEFYVYKSRVSPHSIIKLPKNIKVTLGTKTDLESMDVDQEAKRELKTMLEEDDNILIIAKAKKGCEERIIAYSFVSNHLPRDLNIFYNMKEDEIYARASYVSEKYRRMGIFRNIVKVRDKILLREGKRTRISLTKKNNIRMNTILASQGNKPIAQLTSVRILGLKKRLSFVKMEEN